MEEKINAEIIIEVIGKPPEHLVETLNDLIKKLSEEKGIKIKSKKINDPVLLKDQKDFFSSFAEIEIESAGMLELIAILFKYMPAHVDIISPENIKMSNHDWMEIMNEILRKLHGYDEIARIVQNEKMIMEKHLKKLIEEKNKKKD